MSYGDIKLAAKDLTKAALNGSPYWRVGVSVFVLALCGYAAWGYYTYARADAVDGKIEAANAPIKSDIAKLSSKVDDLAEESRETKAILIDNAIMTSQKSWCDAYKKGVRATATADRIRELKRKYRALTGEEPEVPPCNEI